MFARIQAGVLWTAVVAMLAAFLFKAIPFDQVAKFVFWIIFIMAFLATGHTQVLKKRGLVTPVSSENVRVSIAGQIYTGDSLTVLQLQGGGLFVSVDLGKYSEDEDKEEPTRTLEPVKVGKKR